MKKAGAFFRYAIIFAIGAIGGTAYDYIHVYYGVLSYTPPDYAGTSLKFVPLEFGLSAIAAALLIGRLARIYEPPRVGWARLAFDAALLAVGYLATGWLAGGNAATAAALAVLAAASVLTRPRRFVLVCSFVAAIAGPVGEILISSAGIFHYNVATPIPYWLPLLWVIAAGTFIDVERLTTSL